MIYIFWDDDIDPKWNRDNIEKALSLSKGNELGCIYVGENINLIKSNLVEFGVHKLFFAEILSKDIYLLYVKCICEICEIEKPELIIFPGSKLGKAVAATCEILLDAGLVADCIDISLDKNEKYIFSRTALNSSIIAQIVGMNCSVILCTTKQNAFLSDKNYRRQTERDLEVIKINIDSLEKIKACNYEVIQSINKMKPSLDVDLMKAKVVINIGRGVNKQNIDRLLQISQISKIGIGCTRAVVEEGNLPQSMQIGQSGKVITPELLILLGISGASQHVAGILNAKKIIAVNIDKDAPIKEYSDIFILADVNEVIPYLINYYTERRNYE